MTTIVRMVRFNAVGAMGVGVQLAALWGFNRLLAGHYLWASATALEVTLLHNFAWHRRYTWGERRGESAWGALARFHLSSGLVSLVGNLGLMRLLVREAHLPVLVANGCAIACCSLANFWLAHGWAFAGRRRAIRGALQAGVALILVVCAGTACGQTATTEREFGTDAAYENVFVGPVATEGAGTGASFTGGVTVGQYFAKVLGRGIVASPQFELGVVGPLPGGYPLDGLVSVDAMFANKIPGKGVFPFATIGYTRMFVTGNAVNFGVGVDFGKKPYERLLRVEVRDYYLFTGPRQHAIGLRIGFGKLIDD